LGYFKENKNQRTIGLSVCLFQTPQRAAAGFRERTAKKQNRLKVVGHFSLIKFHYFGGPHSLNAESFSISHPDLIKFLFTLQTSLKEGFGGGERRPKDRVKTC
jgi:hypothetical protein